MTEAEKKVRGYVGFLSGISYLSAEAFAHGVLAVLDVSAVISDLGRKEICSGCEPSGFLGRYVCLRYYTLDVAVSDDYGTVVQAAAVGDRGSDNHCDCLSAAEFDNLLHSFLSSSDKEIL